MDLGVAVEDAVWYLGVCWGVTVRGVMPEAVLPASRGVCTGVPLAEPSELAASTCSIIARLQRQGMKG